LHGYNDIYVHYSFFSALLASITVRPLGGRVFYWNCGEPWKYQRSAFREFFERFTYKVITFLVTGTEGLKQQYAKHYNLPLEKIKVMPNWIDLRRVESDKRSAKGEEMKKKLNIFPDQRVILFAHRLSKRKGAHYLPEILNRLKDQNVVLIIVGDGPERENLQLQITNYQLQDKVRFLGWVPQSQVLRYFTIADVFLMPSEEEGFPHVLLEAMAMGTPFIASDVGGVKETIPPEMSEYVVPLGNVEEFSKKLDNVISKSDKEIKELKFALMKGSQNYDIFNALIIFKSLFI
jgi:glycosyltransferase involved in cell wall biosynthesis